MDWRRYFSQAVIYREEDIGVLDGSYYNTTNLSLRLIKYLPL